MSDEHETYHGLAIWKDGRVAALKKSRLYELRAIEGGRKTDAEIREDTRLRVAKHRAAKRL